MVRVLFVTGHPPWPPISGGRRREHELISRLAERYSVAICSIDKDAEPGSVRALPGGPVPGWAFGPTARPGPVTGATAPATAAGLEAAHWSDPARMWMRDRVRRGLVDLVHCEGYFLRQLLPPDLDVPLVMGTQNVEHHLVAQRSRRDRPGPVVEACEHPRWRSAQGREVAQLSGGARVVCVTRGDAEAFASLGVDATVVPNCCDHLGSPGRGTGSPVDVLMVGNYAYEPNLDAAHILCRVVLPSIRARRPDVRLRLVGNRAEELLAPLAAAGVELVGPVDSVRDHLSDAAVVAAPLRVGGGVKIKILEALHAGAAIVCTGVAAQGLEEHGGALVVEDDWSRFADAVTDLLACPDQLRTQREGASRYAASLPGWDAAAERLDGVWQEALLSARQGSVA